MNSFETVSNLIDPSTLCGQLVQATLQVIIWNQIFKSIQSYVKEHCGKSSWYLHATEHGEAEAEFKQMICNAMPQHTVSCILCGFGWYYNSPMLFSMGTLGEFAFEFIDLFSVLTAKYIYNNCGIKDDMISSIMFHHIPGLLIIIPTNLYFGDHPQIQKLVFSLLAVAPLFVFFMALQKTRNVYDLKERGQFTVYSLIVILILLVSRFYWTPSLMIAFLFDGFMELSVSMQLMIAAYGLLINVFNVLFCGVLCRRLYGFLYGGTCIDGEDTKEKVCEFPSMPKLKQCKSSPLFCTDYVYAKKLN